MAGGRRVTVQATLDLTIGRFLTERVHEHSWGGWLADAHGVRRRACLVCPAIEIADPT